jgi:hypothetical protein
MEGQSGGDLLWPEGPGVFLFVHQFNPPYPYIIVIEVKFPGVVYRMTDFHLLADIGGRDLVYGPFETDGGIVIDDSFMAKEEDLIELTLGKPSDVYS